MSNLHYNAAGFQLNKEGKDIIATKILFMNCAICNSRVFLMSMNDGDTIACTSNPYEHKTGLKIDYNNLEILNDNL